ncbi:glycoside hydrolase family 5 protein [Pseudomonas sp. CFBP 8770]|nr:glycoside hydrolase family 5 protein [Pseudomonas sp. CFBP 8773]MBD8646061.1 glycoside hydrolase family 5 protein [Pseudomonas sp. CFBP 8770]
MNSKRLYSRADSGRAVPFVPQLHPSRPRRALLSVAMALVLGSGAAFADVPMVQINVSGAEFSENAFPGVEGTHYFFPREGFFANWKRRGIQSVRFPLKWERLQPTLGGAFDPTYAKLIDKMLVQAAQANMQVILDVHNYGRYRGKIIGTREVTVAHYKNLMTQMARRWSPYSALAGYDLMNEPHDESDAIWPTAAQAGIDAIRSIDKTRPIYVEGRSWASAERWPHYNDELLKLKDPSNKLIFSAHIYIDPDGSGNYKNRISGKWDPDIGVNRAKPFVEWLKRNGKKGHIGEFGVPDNDPRWLDAAERLHKYLALQCMPLTYWSSGPYWGGYFMAVEPINGKARPQWSVMGRYLKEPKCKAIGPT